MRQAYDYWQNQPGNYLNAKGAPDGSTKGLISRKRWKVMIPGRDDDRDQRPTLRKTARLRNSLLKGYPIAPTEFPKRWSTAEIDWSHKDSLNTVIYTLQEEDTEGQSQRSKNHRIPTPAYPQKSSENLDQMANSPQTSTSPKSKPFGIRLPLR